MHEVPLQRGKRQKRPGSGDLFRVRPLDLADGCLCGWVLTADATLFARGGGGIVVCVFTATFGDTAALRPGGPLLLPPTLTNQRGWTLGYFEAAGHEPVDGSSRHAVPPMIFRVPPGLLLHRPDASTFVDEHRRPVPPPEVGHTLSWTSLHSLEQVADRIVDALSA